jgi:hypothetical protein
MGKDQCQKQTSLLQQEVVRDIHHADKQRRRQSKGHRQLVKTRHLTRVKSVALAS